MATTDAPVADRPEQEEEKPLKMSVEIEELDNWKRKLSIEIEKEDVNERYENLLTELGGSAKLDGFRQGHVPRQLILNKFGKDLDEDVKKQLVGDSFRQATEQKELKVVGEPELDLDKIEFAAEESLSYEATVEIEPEFELPTYKGIKIKAESSEVTDKDVDESIDSYRRRVASLEPARKNAKIKDGDVVTIDAAVAVDGKEAWKEEEHAIGIHKDHMHGFPFKVEADLILGGKVNEEKTATVELPEGFKNEEFAGKEGELTVKILELKRPVLPDLDDEFAKGMGAESVDELKAKAREQLEAGKEQEGKSKIQSDLIDALIDSAKFDLPEGMVDREATMSIMEQQMQMINMGVAPDKVAEMLRGDDQKEKAKENVVRQIKTRLILERIADAEELGAEEDEVHEEIARIAASSGRPMGVVHRELADGGRLDAVRDSVRRRKVLDFLVEEADIKKAGKGSKKKS